MDSKIKADWVARLRSKDYPQGRSYLKRGGNYCCLGVLCEMAAEAGVVVAEPGEPDWLDDYERGTPVQFRGPNADDDSFDSSYNTMPTAVLNWAGIPGGSGGDLPRAVDGVDTLWQLNDSMEYTFAQIADVIEEQF